MPWFTRQGQQRILLPWYFIVSKYCTEEDFFSWQCFVLFKILDSRQMHLQILPALHCVNSAPQISFNGNAFDGNGRLVSLFDLTLKYTKSSSMCLVILGESQRSYLFCKMFGVCQTSVQSRSIVQVLMTWKYLTELESLGKREKLLEVEMTRLLSYSPL